MKTFSKKNISTLKSLVSVRKKTFWKNFCGREWSREKEIDGERSRERERDSPWQIDCSKERERERESARDIEIGSDCERDCDIGSVGLQDIERGSDCETVNEILGPWGRTSERATVGVRERESSRVWLRESQRPKLRDQETKTDRECEWLWVTMRDHETVSVTVAWTHTDTHRH